MLPYLFIAPYKTTFEAETGTRAMVKRFLKTYKILHKINETIKKGNTGNPEEFSKALNISKRQLTEYIKILKELNCPVKYSRSRITYYYNKGKGLEDLGD